MPAKRKDFSEAIALYGKGFSIEAIAKKNGVSRQSIWRAFTRRKINMRQYTPAASVKWNGGKYTLRENGYMARTVHERAYLHRDVWSAHNGPIPEGYEIHHKDENKLNNKIENLEILTRSEHGAKHGFGGNQNVPSIGRRPVK